MTDEARGPRPVAWEVADVAALLHREAIGCVWVPVDSDGLPWGQLVKAECRGDHTTEAMALIANVTPTHEARAVVRELAASHRHIRRVGFPEHRDDECYCDTCWGYLVDEAGGDPERTADDAS